MTGATVTGFWLAPPTTGGGMPRTRFADAHLLAAGDDLTLRFTAGLGNRSVFCCSASELGAELECIPDPGVIGVAIDGRWEGAPDSRVEPARERSGLLSLRFSHATFHVSGGDLTDALRAARESC